MQRWKKHFWTGSLLTISVLLIVAAVAMGAVRLVDLAAPKYREKLASKLSESLDLPVTIDGIGMSWRAFRPSFELDNVIVLDANRRPVFQVGHIDLPFKWGSLLQGELFPYLIQLNELAIALEWRADGSIGIRGIEQEAEGGELDLSEILAYLDRINRIEIVDSALNWDDFGAQIGLTRVEKVNASLIRTARGVNMSLNGRLPRHLGEEFSFDADLKGDFSDPTAIEVSTFFSTQALYADGWLAPVLRETSALRGGPAKVQFSSHWQGLEFKDAALRIFSNPLTDVGSVSPVELPGVNVELKIAPLGDGWDMDVHTLQYWYQDSKSPVSRGAVRYQPTPDGFGTRVDAELDSMRAADLMAWLSVLAITGDGPLPVGKQVKGQLLNSRFEYIQATGSLPQYNFSAQLNELGMPAAGVVPGMKGMNGRIYATQDAGRFEVSTESGVLDFPAIFSSALQLDKFGSILHWERENENWRFFSEDLKLTMQTLKAEGKLQLLFDDQPSPEIDLTLDFGADDIMPLKPYIPLPPVLPQEVGEWLQASLMGGEVPSGKFELKGRLADFPYEEKGQQGLFRIAFKAKDTTLSYSPGWPVVEEIQGDAVFRGRSMKVRAHSGKILNVPIGKTVAAIPDFLNPVLEINGLVQGDVGKQLMFLGESPLREDYQGLLDAITISGPGRLDLKLAIPLSQVEDIKITGDINLQGATLEYQGLNTAVKNIRGDLQFSESGLSAKELRGEFLGVPVSASLTPVLGANKGMTALNAWATVTMPEDAPRFADFISPGQLDKFSGQTEIHVKSQFDASASSSELAVSTDLKGMNIGLGEPFAKRADEVRNVSVVVSPTEQNTDIHWNYANSLQGKLRFRSTDAGSELLSGRVHLGPAGELSWPKTPSLLIDGSLPALDLSALPMAGGSAGTKLPPFRLNIDVGHLKIAGQEFTQLNLRSGVAGNQTVTTAKGVLDVDSKEAAGRLSWQQSANGRLLVSGDFQTLYLHVPEELGEQMETGVAEDAVASEPLDPAQLPALNLQIKNFRLGDEGLGSLKLDTQPIKSGLRIALFEIGGRRIEVRGGGEWVRNQGQSSARLVMNINGNDIVGLLNATGYAPSITAEQADVFMELDWAPDVKGLELANLNGKMSFDLQDGSLLEVKPGAGRVLSLLSFYSLPRRLTLDFSDVLGKGTAFDKLTGDFAIQNGNATTENLQVIMPSARIEVRGRVGLADRDYDQTVTITPEISSGVALAGAVLGGPVLGIGLWIAQEFMDKPLDQVAQIKYRLTGSWDDPEVEGLGGRPAKKRAPVKKGGPKASSTSRMPTQEAEVTQPENDKPAGEAGASE